MKIIKILIIIISLTINSFAVADTIWDISKDEILDYIKNEEANEDSHQKTLDAQIELDLHLDNLKMGLDECLDIALENNLNLKIAKTDYDIQKWELNSKKSEFIPDIYSQFTISKLNGAFLVGGISPQKATEIPITVGVHMEYNAFENNKLFFELKQRQLLKKSSVENAKFTRDEVILNTTIDYYDLLEKKFNIDVLRTNLQERFEELRENEARYKIGVGAKYDVLRAEAEYYQAKQELITALTSLRFAQVKLARTMGIDLLIPIYPKDKSLRKLKLMEDNLDIETLYEYAMQVRPDIKQKEYELKAMNVKRYSNWGDFIPRANIYYEASGVGLARTGLKYSDTMALQLQMPMGQHLSFKTHAQYKIDTANYQKSQLEFLQYQRDIKQSILEEIYNIQATTEKINASEKEIAASQMGLEYSLVRMNIGESTFIDVLNSQAMKKSSKQEFLLNLTEYNKAQVRLLFNSGIITVSKILEAYKKNNK